MRAPLRQACGRATLRLSGGRNAEGGISLEGEELEQMGPIDFVAIEFRDGKPTGEAAPLLVDLVDRGIIRILDLMFIMKNEDGSVSGVEMADLDGDGKQEFSVFEGASSGVLDDEDAASVGEAMEPGSAALLIVFENRWAAPFAIALRKAGGQLVAFDRIPVQALLAALDTVEANA
jgi:Family of unknown function (DUF6325)